MKEKTFNRALFKIRLLDRAQNAPKKEIASRIGVSPSTLSKWLSKNEDATPSVNDLLNISKAYNCSVDYLLGVTHTDQLSRLSTRDKCALLLMVLNDTRAKVDVAEDYSVSRSTNGEAKAGYNSKRLEITVFDDQKENKTIIDFFYKLAMAQKVPDLPKEIYNDLIYKYLSDLEVQKSPDPHLVADLPIEDKTIKNEG